MPPRLLICILCMPLSHDSARGQDYLPLDFAHPVQPNNDIWPNGSSLGPGFFNGATMEFTNVTTRNGLSVDARVSILGTAGSYGFVGWIPDYNNSNGQPEGDLGVYYRHTGDFSEPTGGIAYTLSFYEGGGSFSTAVSLSDFRILIYDHDGEPGQSESIRTYLADGFTGYQIADESGIHAHDLGDMVQFDAGGHNLSETNSEGGFIVYYQNASSIRFDMFSTTRPSNPTSHSGVFAAFDGDLSLTDGETPGFGTYVPVPEPSTTLLVSGAIALILLRRRRLAA
jgi:hypothetical protein